MTAVLSRNVLVFLISFLSLSGTGRADDFENKKAFAEQLTNDIVRSGLRKIYVPDFTDSLAGRVTLGRYFAASVSTLLNDNAKGFAVASRVEVHRYLRASGRTDRDLSTPDVLAKLMSDLGLDAILWGSISMNRDEVTINLVARNSLGKELFKNQRHERLSPILQSDFTAQVDTDFYFVGLDGITMPKCLYCPIPPYPIGQGNRSLEGDVILSVLVTVDGKPDQIRIVQKLGPDLDRAAIEGVQSWRFSPSKDPYGRLVPVRLPVQITFKMHWQFR